MFKWSRVRVVTPIAVLGVVFASALVAISADSQVRPVNELSVVDARGKLVGPVMDVRGTWYPTVVIRVGSTLVILEASTSELIPSGATVSVGIYFETAACTGEALAEFWNVSDPLFPPVPINGSKVYAYSGPARFTTVNSQLQPDGTCVPNLATSEYAPVELLVDLASEFQPPFRLRYAGDD